MPTLRDLLYLDRQRVRQLLAQVDGGVLEKIVERATEGLVAAPVQPFLKTVDLQRELTREAFEETTVSLEDALLDLLVTSLDELDWITYVEGLDDAERWASGEVHAQLTPGALLRLVAQVATVPDEAPLASDDEEDDEGALDRAHFEALAVNTLRGLEDAGLTGAPAFPTITVTPIALYRGGLDE